VAAAFQTALNLHPAIVFIETGTSDISWQIDSTPIGPEWEQAADAIIKMVQMAQRANIKVILGNAVAFGYNSDLYNGWLQTYAQAKNLPLVNFQYWMANGCASVIPPPQNTYYGGPASCPLLTPYQYPLLPVPNDMGYQFMSQMAQSAIATSGLTIKGGYLSSMWTDSLVTGQPIYQVNTVSAGEGVQFTPQATWSDGVTRPMWNLPYQGAFNTAALGTWWSSNPKVMTINQQGHAVAYTSGTAQMWFKSATGQTFSPWTMTVYGGWYGVPEPIY
jgi:hypothetical protein